MTLISDTFRLNNLPLEIGKYANRASENENPENLHRRFITWKSNIGKKKSEMKIFMLHTHNFNHILHK
jgi:hypothetical protein